jgi:endonuclease YncB( thermonuclease family)
MPIPNLKNQKQISKFLLTTFLLVLFYWLSTEFELDQKPITTDNLQVSTISGVARVTDGDSIIINKNRIRLNYIDAPEVKQKCLDKNYFEYKCGEVSTTFLKKLVEGKNLVCNFGKKDIYNRYLAICKLDQININYEMVKNGMAVSYNLKEADEELKELERKAQKQKMGMWQGAFEEPKEFRKKQRK